MVENFVLSLETLSSLGFEERNLGCPGNFAGMSQTLGGVQKVCAKEVRAHFSFPKSVNQEAEGDMKNQGEKQTKKQKKTKCQDMKSTHLLGGCLLGHIRRKIKGQHD